MGSLAERFSTQTVSKVLVKKSVWNAVDKSFHLLAIGLSISNYASATFVSRENHNSVILLQAFEGLFHVFSYLRLRWLRLSEKIINSSPAVT